MPAADPFRELEPVHKRHLNVSNDYIRQQPVNRFCRFTSVFGLVHDFKAVFRPINLGDNPFSYILFVFGKN
ncbi:hypothetical protein D3C85_1766770 [compost metagenome]